MKTTLDIHDELRRVLAASPPPTRYRLADLRAGEPDAPDPLEGYSWPELREATYGDSGAG